jgi:hypothetical protein
MPVGRGLMWIDRAEAPGLFVTNTASSVYCSHDTFTLTANISAGVGIYPPGNITFVTWTGGVATTQGTGAINPANGNASYTMGANALNAGQTYYIQATYPGSGSYLPQSTPANTAGTRLLPTTSLATSASITTYPVSEFCIYSNETVTVTVNATGTGSPPAPTDGTVTVYAEGDGGPYSLGSAALSGSNSVVVPLNDGGLSWNWPTDSGTFPIYAVYSGDGTCYAASPQSANVNLTTFINTVSMFAPSGPTKVCNGDGSNVSYTVYIFASTAGTISGTLELLSNSSGLLSSQVISVPYTGQTITFTFSDSAFGALGAQQLFANFQPNTTTGCYNGANSPLSPTVTVVNSSTQTPGLSIVASLTNGFSYGSGVTTINTSTETGGNPAIYLLADVTRSGSAAGLDSGSVYYYIWTSSGDVISAGVFFTNVFFTDSGTSTITPQATLPATFTSTESPPLEPDTGYGTYYVQAQYTGNGCYSVVNSNVITLIISQSTE